MDSIFEKVTLYDILGYMLPGSLIMLTIVCVMVINQGTSINQLGDLMSLYDKLSGIFWYGFLLLSYLCGILLSEISRMLKPAITFVWSKVKEATKRKKQNASEKPAEDRNEMDRKNYPVSAEAITAALKNAKVIADGNGEEDIEKHISYMYGVIQSDKNYKRIHNYASAEVMYKNMAFAVFISAGIFWHRHKRFCKKKQDYAISWFVEKYSGGLQNAEGK